MKKTYLFASLAAVLLGYTSCDEDYTDWADPQTNDQEDYIDAVTASFAATSSSISMDGMTASDQVGLVSFTSASVDDASFSPSSLTINGTEVGYTYDDDTYYVSAYTLDSIIRDAYGSRASVARELTVQVSGAVIVDEQGLAAESDEFSVSVTPISTPDEDPAGYYLLGDFVDQSWSLTSPIWMESQGDGIYIATVTTSSDGSNWYKFYEGSYYSDSDWDTVNQGQMGCEVNGDESLSGYIVWTGDDMAADGVQTPVISGEGTFQVTIDVVNMTYSVESVSPEIWYLVGGCIGDGTWSNNSADDVGVSLYPLASSADGVITYTGYFTTDGFKLIKTPGSWDDQWGWSDTDGYVKNDGSSGNLWVDTEGYYTVTLDYRNDVLTIEAAESDYTTYDQMGVSGDFNSWGFEQIELATGSTHLWRYELSSDDDTTLKFLTDSSWSVNWGSDSFPSGIGVQNGSNIPVEAGSYVVIFNDIDGGYSFTSK